MSQNRKLKSKRGPYESCHRIHHGSPPNTSDKRRCGYTMRFIPANVRLNPTYADQHIMYLARGENLIDQSLADPTRSYDDVLKRRLEAALKLH